jgi:hypothetical protein
MSVLLCYVSKSNVKNTRAASTAAMSDARTEAVATKPLSLTDGRGGPLVGATKPLSLSDGRGVPLQRRHVVGLLVSDLSILSPTVLAGGWGV